MIYCGQVNAVMGVPLSAADVGECSNDEYETIALENEFPATSRAQALEHFKMNPNCLITKGGYVNPHTEKSNPTDLRIPDWSGYLLNNRKRTEQQEDDDSFPMENFDETGSVDLDFGFKFPDGNKDIGAADDGNCEPQRAGELSHAIVFFCGPDEVLMLTTSSLP